MYAGDVLWLLGWIAKIRLDSPSLDHYGWKGFMTNIHNSESSNSLSVISYLPIINASPTDYSTIYTLFEYINQSHERPCIVTFDCPLCKKL